VWHARSNWMRRESTGAHFTLKLANSGSTSVGRARFFSAIAAISFSNRNRSKTSMFLENPPDVIDQVRLKPVGVGDQPGESHGEVL
jgi:hypothetical protein